MSESDGLTIATKNENKKEYFKLLLLLLLLFGGVLSYSEWSFVKYELKYTSRQV